MRVKYSKIEKVAGLFVLTAFFGTVLVLFGTAVKKGWFRVKVPYFTLLENSEGVKPGTPVELAGVRIGTVDTVDFTESRFIKVRILIFKRFQDRIRRDSMIQLIRPYVIGDKVMYLTQGSLASEPMPEGSMIKSEEVVGLTDILNGRKLIPYVQTIGAAFKEIKDIVDFMLKNKSSSEMIKALAQLGPLLSQLNRFTGEMTLLAEQFTRNDQTGKMVRNLASISEGFSTLMPDKQSTKLMAKNMTELVANMTVITEEFKKLLPAVNEIAPDLPRTSRRLVEAIDEAVVVLKALQRSFLLRGSAKDIKKEEAEERGENTNTREYRAPNTPSYPGGN